MKPTPSPLAPLLLAVLGCLAGNGQAQEAAAPSATVGVPVARLLDVRQMPPLDELIPQLAEQRVVYVGESHTDYAHHLQQLAILRALRQRNPRLAIGLEMIQQPFQPVLDDYLARRIDEREFLVRTEWYSRWRYDFRLYRPILEFARAEGLPVIALNLPKELTERVAKRGIAGLDEAEKAQLPQEIDRSDQAYEARLRDIFAQHPHQGQQDFQRFLEVQLLWDEGMAQRAAEFLEAHADTQLVILAGSGHLMYRSGIPNRLTRRLPVSQQAAQRVVLPAGQVELAPGVADYLLLTGQAQLPPAGILGVALQEPAPDGGGVTIEEVIAGGAAAKAGLRKGDRILELAGQPIAHYADLKIALLDRPPGEVVRVRVRRSGFLFGVEEIALDLTLGAEGR